MKQTVGAVGTALCSYNLSIVLEIVAYLYFYGDIWFYSGIDQLN